MLKWSDTEYILTLAFYLLDDNPNKSERVVQFTEKLNVYTGGNRTESSINLRISNYKAIDPKYKGKGMSHTGKHTKDIWDEFVIQDSLLIKITTIYSNFLNKLPIDFKPHNIESTDDNQTTKTSVSVNLVYNRSTQVKEITLKRAQGVCELCRKIAPFEKDDGTPYLEVHHLVSLSNNGKDSVENCIALCPNCHRKLHYGKLKLSQEEQLRIADIFTRRL